MKTFDELLTKARARGYKSLLTDELMNQEVARFDDGLLLYPQMTETLLIGCWVQVHSKKVISITGRLINEMPQPEWQELIDELYDLLDEWPVIDKI
jgi:hypothetical protein